MKLEGKKLLLGVTGGIAAYKTPNLVRLAKKSGADVRVVMTESAQKFITPLTLATVSENCVGLELFDQPPMDEVRHIQWADWSDLAIIAPATANILAKMANGLADDLLSSLILALQCPLIVVPAMHHQMWSHPAVQKNMDVVRSYGYHIVEPARGELASGDVGMGRMQEPEEILAFIEDL
ncbi:hypothetical protein GF373_15720 [bacterium]|nr:hypothetical protein [bacterium]